MTVHRGPGVRQIGAVGTTPREHRLAIAGQYAENGPGVPRSGLLVPAAANAVSLTAATGTLTYTVGAVSAVINRAIGEGVYTPSTAGVTTVNTTAAPASGSRYDLIWIKQNDQEKGDIDNQAVLGVTQGASAATPTRPTAAVPAGALVIAEARIFSGATSTIQSPNTITQVYPITAARGATIPVRTATERDAITPFMGMQIKRLDLGSGVETWDGTKWMQFIYAEASAATTNAGSGVPWGAGQFSISAANSTDQAFISFPEPDCIQFTHPGLYAVSAHVMANAPLSGFTKGTIQSSNGLSVYGQDYPAASATEFAIAAPVVYFPAPGGRVYLKLLHNSGVARNFQSVARVLKVG